MLPITIPRRSRHCMACKETLCPGAEYTSVLTEDDKKGALQRHDFCFRCWDDERIEQLKSIWKAVVPEKKSAAKDPEGHYDEVLDLMRDEMEKDTEQSKGYAFVLALYLTRKRQIALRQEIDFEGQQAYIYEVLNTEEILCVKNMTLTLDRLQGIQETLIDKFKH